MPVIINYYCDGEGCNEKKENISPMEQSRWLKRSIPGGVLVYCPKCQKRMGTKIAIEEFGQGYDRTPDTYLQYGVPEISR